MQKAEIGIIGGSALYSLEGAKLLEEIDIETPWGKPSDSISIVEMDGHKAAFLPRHGRGHVYLPHEVNYRANIAAFKMIGVKEIIAFSAVGSLKEEIAIRDFTIPNQIIDRTKARPSSFFGNGIAAHIAFAEPFCPRLVKVLESAAKKMELRFHTNETVVCMEGPAFSTKAESNMYRSLGAGIINMSVLPEAKLAREAEICYGLVCMTTDYDCWHESEEEVSIAMVVENLSANAENARALIKNILPMLGKEQNCSCPSASENAVITDQTKWPSEQRAKLTAILPNYFE